MGQTTVANFATVQKEGDRRIKRNVEYYNLDVIISVGYRVKSQQGTHFGIWATKVLRDYLLKPLLQHPLRHLLNIQQIFIDTFQNICSVSPITYFRLNDSYFFG
jgi:hypothetical protein